MGVAARVVWDSGAVLASGAVNHGCPPLVLHWFHHLHQVEHIHLQVYRCMALRHPAALAEGPLLVYVLLVVI